MASMQSYAAATDLGVGSDLGQQLIDETEEQRKKRMKEAQGGSTSPAVAMLLGNPNGI